MISKLRYLITFFLLLAGPVSKADNGQLFFSFDYALFRDPGGASILEVYYSVPQRLLIYSKDGSGFSASVKIEVEVKNKLDGNILHSNAYKTPSVVRDTADKNSMQNLVGQLNFMLNPGTYVLTMKGSDFENEEKVETYETEFIADNNSAGKCEISDIEWANAISKSSNDKSIFYKNTLEVIPNPSGLFGKNLPNANYYLEYYGLTSENVGEKYSIIYSVLLLKGDTIFRNVKNFNTKAPSKADYGTFKVDTLQSGTYVFAVSVIGADGTEKASREKKFYIFSESVVKSEPNKADGFLMSEFAAMSEEDLEKEVERMIYIMPEKQYDQYEVLKSLDDKRKFIYSFWKSRDAKPETQILETRFEYLKRVNEANKNFKESFKEGWKSDRGRIYIIYGKPDDIERYPFETSTKSYEVWKYDNVEGGGECDFVELQPMTGVYWLVNSTFRNELQNPNWRDQLKP